jgi:hypothetical protein
MYIVGKIHIYNNHGLCKLCTWENNMALSLKLSRENANGALQIPDGNANCLGIVNYMSIVPNDIHYEAKFI